MVNCTIISDLLFCHIRSCKVSEHSSVSTFAQEMEETLTDIDFWYLLLLIVVCIFSLSVVFFSALVVVPPVALFVPPVLQQAARGR